MDIDFIIFNYCKQINFVFVEFIGYQQIILISRRELDIPTDQLKHLITFKNKAFQLKVDFQMIDADVSGACLRHRLNINLNLIITLSHVCLYFTTFAGVLYLYRKTLICRPSLQLQQAL